MSFREHLREHIGHLEHVLPGQAPIRDFVHHNTLHGFQHLPFAEAIAAARAVTGYSGWMPEAVSRNFMAAGRIDREDLADALDTILGADTLDEAALPGAGPTRRDVLLASFEHDLSPLAPARLRWRAREESALEPRELWQACLAATGATWRDADPEDEVAEPVPADWPALADRLGRDWTLAALLRELTGEDILDALRPGLIRHLAAHLDLGLAGWANPGRRSGFYSAWRAAAAADAAWELEGLAHARQEIAGLPADPVDAIEAEFARLGLPGDRRLGYLDRLALELPGWSGMFLWRHLHPGYGCSDVPVDMADYLAVRLVLERLHADALCRRRFGVPARLADLAALRHRSAARDAAPAACTRAWPLFGLASALGLPAAAVDAAAASRLLALLDGLDADRRGLVWLLAYERNFRQRVFAALAANHGRSIPPAAAPEAQLVFCMDDREEGMRRHLEEIAPRVETLGAAAHFGVFQYWYGLDDQDPTVLCPVVARPMHTVREEARPGAEAAAGWRRQGLRRRDSWRERLHQRTHRGLFEPLILACLAAPAGLAALAGRLLAPARWAGMRRRKAVPVATRIAFAAPDDGAAAAPTPDAPRAGFLDGEQADRIGAFLRNMGLTGNFAPLVVIVGHGSDSRNNPHLAAYDCGACSGRHSGPNARLFAAMANRPEVRRLLAERGIAIPEGTWFLGAEHNTCDDLVCFYDLEDLPPPLREPLGRLRESLAAAGRAHARERCRRFASAPLDLTPAAALAHVADRREDFSQARPELGHATNAWALIGRRSATRGAFFDRRAFLISYDPTQDPDGRILEGLLLANGPVGAGINLEYYFSTVNNEQYGCGTKIMHNVAGHLGVMEGANSDLRTGLPRQMIEIHEAMRLLVVVEAKTATVTAIYGRQPPLQELIGNGWLVVAAKDPDSPAIHLFDPRRGWLPWWPGPATPAVAASADWYSGQREPLPPALLGSAA